jgi:hypothetical protein
MGTHFMWLQKKATSKVVRLLLEKGADGNAQAGCATENSRKRIRLM